jgi:tRNA pseudouridine-54 N-methylase
MSAQATLRLVCDARPLEAALAELREAPEQSVQLLLQGIGGAAKLVRFDLDEVPAGAAGERRVLIQPSDALRHFLAAVRARNVECGIVENVVHESSVLPERVGGTPILSTCEGSPIRGARS